MDVNQYDDGQNTSNNDGSYYDGNHEMVQISQVNNNTPPMQFNVVLLESYDTIHNVQLEWLTNE